MQFVDSGDRTANCSSCQIEWNIQRPQTLFYRPYISVNILCFWRSKLASFLHLNIKLVVEFESPITVSLLVIHQVFAVQPTHGMVQQDRPAED